MTQFRAGAYYTHDVCPISRAQDRFYRQIWHGRERISKREVARRLQELKRLSGDYADAAYNWSRDLYNPPADWPSNVARLVHRLANVNLRLSDLLYGQAAAGSARRWLNLNGRINNLPWGHLAANIRVRLDLPRHTRC